MMANGGSVDEPMFGKTPTAFWTPRASEAVRGPLSVLGARGWKRARGAFSRSPSLRHAADFRPSLLTQVNATAVRRPYSSTGILIHSRPAANDASGSRVDAGLEAVAADKVNMFVDPVCKMIPGPSAVAAMLDYECERLYFCSSARRTRVPAEPAACRSAVAASYALRTSRACREHAGRPLDRFDPTALGAAAGAGVPGAA